MKNSIIAGKIARQLEIALQKTQGVASALHQSRTYDLWLHGRLTKGGNAVLWADLDLKPKPEHTSNRETIYKRLHGTTHVYRHAADMAETLRQKVTLLQWREALYQRVERKELPQEKDYPWPNQPYDEMDFDDLNRWTVWVEKLPNKQEEKPCQINQ